MGWRLTSAVTLLACVIALICGDIWAVTSGIPHGGHHHHAPTVLGYIAYYTGLSLANYFAFAFLLLGPAADAFDWN